MNRHTAVSAAAMAAIAAALSYSGASVLGAHELEYRWSGPGEFSFFALSNHGDVELCNPVPFWASFGGLEIDTYYNSENHGTFSVGPAALGPLAGLTAPGTFKSGGIAAAQHIFMTMDYEFGGGVIRLDPNKFVVVTSVHATILGVIPYTATEQISGFDFGQRMGASSLSC